MRGIHLDQLTKDFYVDEFQGFSEYIKLADPILATPVPIVEIPLDLNTELMLDAARNIPIETMRRPSYPYETYPRFKGWNMQVLWSNYFDNTLLIDVYYKKTADPIENKPADVLARPIQDYLISQGIECNMCVLSVFEPGAYLRPHRDIGLNPTPLDYFWMPLNNPLGSELRIYPYGKVDVNLGSMYLLNQENFVHSAVNNSSERRYVLFGHLTNINKQFESLVTDSILKNYKIG